MDKRYRFYTKEMDDFVKNEIQNSGCSVQSATRLMCTNFKLEYDEHLGRSFRRRMQNIGVTKKGLNFVLEDTDEFKKAKKKEYDKDKQYYIITWAQNDTPVHKEFFDNVKAYSNFLNAEILVICGRYQNPSLLVKPSANRWDPSLTPYLTANRHNIHKGLQVLADIKTNPTAVNPLTGIQAFSGLESSIIGHPKQALESIPVLREYPHKLILSTGACTVAQYSDTAAGAKGEFHHVIGAIVVEIVDGDVFNIRQFSANSEDGSFYDLDISVEGGEVVQDFNAVEVVVLGDIHAGRHDEQAIYTSLEMLERFNPNHVILHDIMAGYSISPHERKDPFLLLEKEQSGEDDLYVELDMVKQVTRLFLKWSPVVVQANHNVWIDRHLRDMDWRKGNNKHAYLKYAFAIAEGKCPNGVLAYVLKEEFGDDIKCLAVNESFRINGIEYSQHGDIGSNGSRGSINQFKYYNTKLIIAHSHSPKCQLGTKQVGTLSKLDEDYLRGASSWMHTNAIAHRNGKSQLIHIINGQYSTI